MYLFVLLTVLAVIYFVFIREEAPSQAPQAQETKTQTTTDEPPKPSEPQEGVDPLKAPSS